MKRSRGGATTQTQFIPHLLTSWGRHAAPYAVTLVMFEGPPKTVKLNRALGADRYRLGATAHLSRVPHFGIVAETRRQLTPPLQRLDAFVIGSILGGDRNGPAHDALYSSEAARSETPDNRNPPEGRITAHDVSLQSPFHAGRALSIRTADEFGRDDPLRLSPRYGLDAWVSDPPRGKAASDVVTGNFRFDEV